MSLGWDVTLYGSNTKLEGACPALAAVTALSDVVSVNYTLLGASPEPKTDKTVYDYQSGSILITKKLKWKFNLQPKRMTFPGTTTALETYYSTAVLKMQRHYLDLKNYPLVPDEISEDPTKTLSVNIIDTPFKHDFGTGSKYIEIQLESRENI